MSTGLTSAASTTTPVKSGVLRVLQFPLMRIAAGLVTAAALLVPAQFLTGGTSAVTVQGALTEVYTGLAAGVSLWLVGRFIEKRSLAEVGLPVDRRTAIVIVGFAIGAAVAGASVGILAAAGLYSVNGNGDLAGSMGNLLLLLVFEFGSAALQAILFYGIVFRVLAEWLGRWPAIVLATVLFGAIHLTGPNATAFSAMVVGLSGGVLLAVSYLATRALWLPMGILWGINFMFAEILGAIPSAQHRLLDARLSGSELLSGGAAGAEAGGATLIVVAIAVALMLWWSSTRNRKEVYR
jgi:membrane protease YdiL (CAAX protease family)